MKEKDPRQIQAELAMPFAPEDLEWRLQKVIEARELGIAVPYVTNRAIMGRLDDVVGAENWYNEFKPWHGAGGKEAQLCGISIRYGEGFITKWDGAENSDIEPVKGGLSDSMKRAAVQWGIGRVLYNMDVVFVDVEKRGKTWYMKKDQQERLDYAYLKMLGKLNLTPAPAGGLLLRRHHQSLFRPRHGLTFTLRVGGVDHIQTQQPGPHQRPRQRAGQLPRPQPVGGVLQTVAPVGGGGNFISLLPQAFDGFPYPGPADAQGAAHGLSGQVFPLPLPQHG